MRFSKDAGHETNDEYLAFAGMVYAHRPLSMSSQSYWVSLEASSSQT